MHVANDYTGLQELSMGVTSLRDPGNDDSQTIDRRERAARGELLIPHVYASSLIDGKGTYTAQVANVATSEAEAVALVDKAKANGFIGVKFYGTLNKDWLPAAAAEAHKQGLHVHGHIPVGMRPLDADQRRIRRSHAHQLDRDAGDAGQRHQGVERHHAFRRAGALRQGCRPQRQADHGSSFRRWRRRASTAIRRWSRSKALYVPENGDLSPSYAPFVGTLPPSTERGFRTGGFAVPKDLTRAHYRASWAKMVALLGKMHKAGVPIVAGTDGAGIELVHELEIYVEAGMTPGEALAAATIVPARLVGQDKSTGSIKPGKVADLVLVEGDPSKRIGDLRNTRVIMLDGKLLDADALRAAAGFSGRPK